jgi:hypothetical protein
MVLDYAGAYAQSFDNACLFLFIKALLTLMLFNSSLSCIIYIKFRGR